MKRKRSVEEDDQEDYRLRKRWKVDYSETSDDEEEEEEEDREDYRLRKRWKVDYSEASDNEDEEVEEEEEDRETWKTEGIQFLPVICGTTEGTLDCEKLEQSKACIKYEGKWYKPPIFEILAGKGSSKKWKATILYDNQPLEFWIKKGYLKTEGYRKGGSKTRKEIQSSDSEETEIDDADGEDQLPNKRTTKHAQKEKEIETMVKRFFEERQGTGACHSKWLDHPGDCSSSAKVDTTTAAVTLIAPSHICDPSIHGSEGEVSEEQLPQSSDRKEQETFTSLEILNKSESSVFSFIESSPLSSGEEKPPDMSRCEVTGTTRDVAIQTVPKVLLKAEIQPAEETEGDIVEDKDRFLSRGELAVKTKQGAEEKVGSGQGGGVVNSEDAGNEEEEDELEMGGMGSEPAVASNHKCVIKEGSEDGGDGQSANCENEKEVIGKTRDVERNTPIKQQNAGEEPEKEISPSSDPLAVSGEREHKDVHCSGHNVAELQSMRPERSSSQSTQTSDGINFSHTSEAPSPGPSVSSGLNTMDLDHLKREKIKMQLKVLKLQAAYYTLKIKELKK